MVDSFRPFGMTDDEWEKAQVLRDGAPDDLRHLLYNWLTQIITRDGWLNEGMGLLIRAKTGVDIGERAGSYVSTSNLLGRLAQLNDVELLRLVDFVMATDSPQLERKPPVRLIAIMSIANSKWAPTWDGSNWRLLERVPEGVQTAAEATMRDGTDAGRLLQKAWAAAYSTEPDAGAAYRLAVKAVEAAAHLIVEAGNHRATLGTMARVIAGQAGWTLSLKERDDHVGDNRDMIVRMMLMLYEGQKDRHGAGAITLDESRAAVHAASTLVAWFNAGYVTRTA
jgi:hypothetical protein